MGLNGISSNISAWLSLKIQLWYKWLNLLTGKDHWWPSDWSRQMHVFVWLVKEILGLLGESGVEIINSSVDFPQVFLQVLLQIWMLRWFLSREAHEHVTIEEPAFRQWVQMMFSLKRRRLIKTEIHQHMIWTITVWSLGQFHVTDKL